MWLGSYLWDSGLVSQDAMLRAIGGYFSTRPKIGQLALEEGILGIKEINAILGAQADSPQPFGELAIQLGYLDQSQVEMLIGRQYLSNTLWDYMIENQFITQGELAAAAIACRESSW